MKDILTLLLCLFICFNAFGQASISGQVTDKETGKPILFGDVLVYRNGALITGEQTDFDGNYTISLMDPGTYAYEVLFKYVGYSDLKFENIIVENDKETLLNASIEAGVTLDDCPLFVPPSMIKNDDFEKGQTFTSKDIRRMPNKN